MKRPLVLWGAGLLAFYLGYKNGHRTESAKIGGLRFEIPIDDAMRQAYFAAHWPEMKALAPDLSRDRKHTQRAFQEALDWFTANYPKKPFAAAEDAYRRFRSKNHSLQMQTPSVRKFFLGVLNRIDDMILYEAMRQANWPRRKKVWGHRGVPPIASEGDTA